MAAMAEDGAATGLQQRTSMDLTHVEQQQQQEQVDMIVELVRTHLPPQPRLFQKYIHPHVDCRVRLGIKKMREMMVEMGEQVKDNKELKHVDGIVNLQLCLSLAQLVASLEPPHLRQLRLRGGIPEGVSIEGGEQAMGVLFAALAAQGPSTLLSQLSLWEHKVFGTERVCRHLAHLLTSTHCKLADLTLSGTGMRADGMRRIADALQTNCTLTRLTVRFCQEVGDAGVEHLATMLHNNATLQVLRMVRIGLTGDGARHLWHALSSPKARLKRLILDDNRLMGQEGAEHLGNMLARNSSLEKLSMEQCQLRDAQGRISQGLRNNHTLKKLRLWGNPLDMGGLEPLFECLASHTCSLRTLTVSYAGEMPVARVLGEMLAHNRSLDNLEILTWTADDDAVDEDRIQGKLKHMDDEEGHVSHGLRSNSTLRSLVMDERIVGQRELETLFDSLATVDTSSGLQKLQIRFCGKSPVKMPGAHHLACMLSSNRSLLKLGVSEARYSVDDWVTVILPALAQNQTLKEIECRSCPGVDGDKVLDAIFHVIRTNTVLEDIDVNSTPLYRAGKAEAIKEELKLNKEFRAALSTVPFAKPKSCRIVLCGDAYAGKSTIFQTLKGEGGSASASAPPSCFGVVSQFLSEKCKCSRPSQHDLQPDNHDLELDKRTRGIDIHLLKDDGEKRISMWDIAGHKEFHALHEFMFPRGDNGATLFLFTYSPIGSPLDGDNSGKIKTRQHFIDEFLYWLRFIVSNTKLQTPNKPLVLVVVTRKDKLVRLGVDIDRWMLGIKGAISDIASKFRDVVDVCSQSHLVTTLEKEEVASVLHHMEELFEKRLKELPKVPEICDKVARALEDPQLQATPIITRDAFMELCEKCVGNDTLLNTFLEAGGNGGLRAIAAYLHSAGEIIYHENLHLIVTNPRWFGLGILGHLIDIFSEKGSQEGHARRRTLFRNSFKKPTPSPKDYLSKDGFVDLATLKELLQIALKSVPGLDPQDVDPGHLVQLMKLLNLCFEQNPGDSSTKYFLPAILEDDKDQQATYGKRIRKWQHEAAGTCSGRRLECTDPERTFLTPGFFPRLQVELYNAAQIENWVSNRGDNCTLEKYLFIILVNGMEIQVEYSGVAGYFVDILVKSSQPHEVTAEFVHTHFVSLIRTFCASQKGCQGVTLAEAIIRPECVINLTPCDDRRDQSILLDHLSNCMAKHSNYKHFWEAVKDERGKVILGACEDDAQTLLQGASTPSNVSALALGTDRRYPRHITVSRQDVSAIRVGVAKLRIARAVPLKVHIKCEFRAGEHEVDLQPGRTFYVVNDRFANEQGIRKLLVLFASAALKGGGSVVPGVGMAGEVLGSVPMYQDTPVYSETIESLGFASATVSDEQLQLAVEKDLQDSIAGPWMDAFLKPDAFQAFLSDFRLRKVVYEGTNETAWLCDDHFADGRDRGILKKVN